MRASPCPCECRRARWTAIALRSTDDAVEWLVVRQPAVTEPTAPPQTSASEFSDARARAWRLRAGVLCALSSACAAAGVSSGAVLAGAAVAALLLGAVAALLCGRRTAAEHVVATRGVGLVRSRIRLDGGVESALELRAADVRAVLLHDGFANCSVRWFLLAEVRGGGAAALVLDRARPRIGALADMLRSIAPVMRAGEGAGGGAGCGGAAARPWIAEK
jgi:hypothetical protein